MADQDGGTKTTEIMVGILIAVMIVGAIAMSFLKARSRSASSACLNNLRQLSGAKDQFWLDNGTNAPVAITNLVPAYIRTTPRCPQGGLYTLGNFGDDATCSLAAKKGHTI